MDKADVPIIMNIWTTQGSMKWSGEIWEGGSTRDELVFNPVYAASKAALSALSMHLAREMRVSLMLQSCRTELMAERGDCQLRAPVRVAPWRMI